MNSFKAIIFDLDGTLIDSVPDVRAAVNRVLDEIGRPSLSLEDITGMIGEGAQVMLKKVMEQTGGYTPDMEEEYLGRFLETYKAHPADHTLVYPGVFNVLDQLKADGISLGLCTNKPSTTTLPAVAALDLEKYFEAIVCADMVKHRKPDGRHLLNILERMGADPKSAVMVGDSETDIAAAVDAGLPAIAVSYGYCHVPLDELPCDILIDNMSELPRALAEISKGQSTS
ncbi:MAG: phosphoglycolate phosphatase [Rhodospirillaceae bacterium]|jgi:phosphoglycolate phosphatase|nr:phosphoglycolate phosphatase [Rhodospirillales bacterium]MBT3906146.1 phosphoglycolate phosphatase [Rhodospirillaceae bacterium]MBT4702452.1 phosphoglycolate phosphatase [Rhodospirillaceae bacterium]MBT5034828.1 phosphoglycolate phosphatase [Rhodospirillaceae bacterium]MBT6219703.1 phosphoglycolate phosphatase [Rhodospirillaceae bacterium]